MELTELINKAAGLINQASERVGAGWPDQAKARLQDLHRLLVLQCDMFTPNESHNDQPAAKPEPEQPAEQ